MSAFVFIGGYFLFLSIWFPIYLFSFLVGESGIYLLAIGTVFLVGRSIIRLIAFPGSTNRVLSEIEKEFAKYSVRMLTSSSTSIIDLAQAVVSAGKSGGNDSSSNSGYAYYEIPSLWKRAKSFRDRVLAVYVEVLQYIYDEGINDSSSSHMSDLTKYGNNKISGDIGDLSGLTLEARSDGKVLLEHLNRVLTDMDRLEEQGKSMLESTTGKAQMPSNSVRMIANSLIVVANDLQDFVESLNPPSMGDPHGTPTDSEEADLSVDAVRRRFEEQNSTLMDSVSSGAASILTMLDPPPHTSIFGFDVQRGCMLARYRGARQLWVQRPGGGKIDVIHIPAKSNGPPSQRNPKAVMYCNPNAGLIEVATGMSLAGGNVSTDAEGVVNDNCWADFYTNLGFDVYLFNYAGFGRSFGSGYCGFGKRGGEGAYTKGAYGRVKRILDGTFFSFQPTPATLRADGVALASHLVSELGVESLVIHGESIGGVAASGTARKLSENSYTNSKLALLICDRTFCNLEAVAQRLVGDFIAANCHKLIANDSADAVIADPSSLRSGIALWKEGYRGSVATKGIGWMMDAPIQYRMADFENAPVNGNARTTAPVWPSDKHILLEEGFHFAACTKRLGKLASLEKREFALQNMEEGRMSSTDCQAPIFLIWKSLACCDGLCGSALGVAVKGGFDCTVTWLCCLLTFGGQTLIESMEHRQQKSFGESTLTQLGKAIPSDFDCRPPGYEKLESETIVHPKPLPEVLDAVKKIVAENKDDEMLAMVKHELAFIIGTLQYVVDRLLSPASIESSWKNRHMIADSMTVGSFMNLNCGHNNPFSAAERTRLRDMVQATAGRKS
eukprot:scaffold22568_cov125-Cylindrotheca_fusiformis.AAC.20